MVKIPPERKAQTVYVLRTPKGVRNIKIDESRSLDEGFQENSSNHTSTLFSASPCGAFAGNGKGIER